MQYYNENDKTAVAWLRNLIRAGLIPEGDVDARSITDVQASDLKGYTQCHFFAGIGGWPLALALAGWPTTRPVWTGSAPCQPFSNAGRHTGEADKRHLWPEFQRLIAECRPPTVFGEQVASKAGRAWLSRVRLDLEELAYGIGATDLCAASIGAPHIRQRLYWVADAISQPVRAESRGVGSTTTAEPSQGIQRQRAGSYAGHSGTQSGMADAAWQGRQGGIPGGAYQEGQAINRLAGCHGTTNPWADGGMDNAPGDGAGRKLSAITGGNREDNRLSGAASPSNPWADSITVACLDGKERRVGRGLRVLANGFSGRLGRLRGLGNAIVVPLAAEFIGAYMEG